MWGLGIYVGDYVIELPPKVRVILSWIKHCPNENFEQVERWAISRLTLVDPNFRPMIYSELNSERELRFKHE